MTVDADRAAREVLAAAAKATPGPWHYDEEYAAVDAGPALWVQPEGDRENDDAAFIALARTAAPLLAAEVLRLRETLEAKANEKHELRSGSDAVGAACALAVRDFARAALASSPGHDVARYTAEPSARGDTAPEEPR